MTRAHIKSVSLYTALTVGIYEAFFLEKLMDFWAFSQHMEIMQSYFQIALQKLKNIYVRIFPVKSLVLYWNVYSKSSFIA